MLYEVITRSVDVGEDVEVEVWKDRWKEFFRVGRVKGKGSSKGKTADMRNYKFGFFRITSYNVCYTKLLRPSCPPRWRKTRGSRPSRCLVAKI